LGAALRGLELLTSGVTAKRERAEAIPSRPQPDRHVG
jgi:hypothetical protein